MSNANAAATESGMLAAPSISLPKGGGAIRGIGEKFVANPVTGTGATTVPVWTTSGRGNFGPSLSLSYDSGAGNGPFGLGWTLSLPSITRRTDKGIPRYDDQSESDVFILSGAEDLVPLLGPDGQRIHDDQTAPGYVIDRFRPRVEGLFSRIERWTAAEGAVHWRSITRDNVLTVYGADDRSRIVDPDHAGHVFSWLISETRDDRGNVIVYDYKSENGEGIDLTRPSERNRGARDDRRRSVNRYLKGIRYGNRRPLLLADGARPRYLSDLGAALQDVVWMFEVVLDYGEHAPTAPTPDDRGSWHVRHDAFSSFRAGFECRTNRRCRRILMYHHVPDQTSGARGYDGLVRATELTYSDDLDTPDAAAPAYTMLRAITQTGYRRTPTGAYEARSLPPVEFVYSEPQVQDMVEEVDPANLDHLPSGVDGTSYQWADLHGDGIAGIVSEQAGAWFYTRNESPLLRDRVRFAPTEVVALAPSATLTRDRARFADLAGDGQPDLVLFGGPTPGFFEHDNHEGWLPFRPFTTTVDQDLREHDVAFVDLDGDGHADVLIADEDAWAWHPSTGEHGFAAQRRVAATLDEETGPRVVAAGRTESLQLADLSGDGLSDLVRIRNGEVCYWPNLGHGRFGSKVTMDNAPMFDNVDQFDPARLRLADLDGSGTTDIVYLHRDEVRLYFNLSGNAWSAGRPLPVTPQVDALASVEVTDLLGNGTACLVWSSSSKRDGRRSMSFVNLIGPEKPHLLVGMANNLGVEVRMQYAPSTRFSLVDRRAGRPWQTRLPFPVHVVEQVETRDLIGRNTFVTRYAYHDGYFDGPDREFRGFAMVEQWDSEDMGALAVGPRPEQAPRLATVRTETWFHTGAAQERSARDSFVEPGLTDAEAAERQLAEAELPVGLDADEMREARRALKGMMLRQEVYAEDASERKELPYVVTEHSYAVRQLQPRGSNEHGVYLPHPLQTQTLHYERDPSDPRVAHTLVLETDEYGAVTKQAQVSYGRREIVRVVDRAGQAHDVPNPGLVALASPDQEVQTRSLVTYTETSATNAIDDISRFPDDMRTPQPCETSVYQLTGLQPASPGGRFQASDFVEPDLQAAGKVRAVTNEDIAYDVAPAEGPQRRLIERTRTLFRADDLTSLLPFRGIEPRCLAGETYRLAFTPGLLDNTFQRPAPNGEVETLLTHGSKALSDLGADGGGYVNSGTLKADHRFPNTDRDDDWWVPSGRSLFSSDGSASAADELAEAQQHFFTPRRYRDPFGHDTVVRFDDHDLLILQTEDPVGNAVRVELADYRVLQPQQLQDANGNRAASSFDVLGLVAGTSVMGKPVPAPTEGDSLAGFGSDLAPAQIDAFLNADDPHTLASSLLGEATTRVVYDLDRFQRTHLASPNDPDAWLPVYTATLARETHVSDLGPPDSLKIQIEFSYSDGFGRVIQKKIQAEPGPVLSGGPIVNPRWVGSGWTVFNHKGSPVRQFEPFFSRLSAGHQFEFAAAYGVSPVLFYDPTERVVAALNPNNTYTKVQFGPWRRVTYDVNDTCAARNTETGDPRTDHDVGPLVRDYIAAQDTDPTRPWATWYAQRISGALGPNEQGAAELSAAHADTPTTLHLDPLGRPFLTVLSNRIADTGHPQDGLDELIAHRVELDIEGNRLSVRDGVLDAWDEQGNKAADDPLGRVVMRSTYDLLGHVIRHASFEAGTRWTLLDVAGKVIRRWNSRRHQVRTGYDPLRRPTHIYVTGTDPTDPARELLTERRMYGEQHPDANTLNLRGTVFLHLDQAGSLTNEGHDFKGNPIGGARRLTNGTQHRFTVDWASVDAGLLANPTTPANLAALEELIAPKLDADAFVSHSRYDGLNRPTELVTPHSPALTPSVVRHTYNDANLLERIDLNLHGATVAGQRAWKPLLTNVDYDAKGQRQRVTRGNGVTTELDYDPHTFQLVRLRSARNAASFPDDCPQPALADWPGCGVQDIQFTYDPTGNITNIADGAQQRLFFANRRIEPSADYAYDASYQLIRATGREHLGQMNGSPSSATDAPRVGIDWSANDGNAMATYTERYSYDRAGNLQQLRHASGHPAGSWTRSFTYAEASQIDDGSYTPKKRCNRLTGASTGATAEELQYDSHGNPIRMSHMGDGGPAPNMHWNHLDQLCRIDHGGGGTTYYVYDAGGRRIRTVRDKSPTLTEERIDLGDVDIYRRKQGVELLERQTVHVRDGRSTVATVETRSVDTTGDDRAPAELVRYELSDHLSSVHLELDYQARLISYEEYSPFGATTYQAVRSQTDTPKRFRYTGHERDEGSGLYAMGARYYAPWLCRWTSCDPAGIADSPNLYEYVANNPVRHVDTTGRGLLDKAKAFVADGASRAVAAVKPGGALFEAVDNAFKPDVHPVSAAVLNNMAKRGEGMVEGVKQGLKQAGEDYGDIAYGATHLSEPGAKQKLTAAIDRRQKAPQEMAVGMAKGFVGQLKNVGEGLGTVAYYRPELLGLAGAALPSHAKEQGADAKVASAITDIVLDGPQIVLTVEGGINLAKVTGGAKGVGATSAAPKGAPALPPGSGGPPLLPPARLPRRPVPRPPGQTVDRLTGTPIGEIVVEPNGNALLVPEGGDFSLQKPGRIFMETRYPNGSPYQQLHGPHKSYPQAHGHGFQQGAGRNMRGDSLDIKGNVVKEKSRAAHWDVK